MTAGVILAQKFMGENRSLSPKMVRNYEFLVRNFSKSSAEFTFLYEIFPPIWQIHTCDKFKMGISEVFFSFQGGFSKKYRIYRKIINSNQGDFLVL